MVLILRELSGVPSSHPGAWICEWLVDALVNARVSGSSNGPPAFTKP